MFIYGVTTLSCLRLYPFWDDDPPTVLMHSCGGKVFLELQFTTRLPILKKMYLESYFFQNHYLFMGIIKKKVKM